MNPKFTRYASVLVFALAAGSAAHADSSPSFSTKSSDPANQASASGNTDNEHQLGSVGVGTEASTNNINGNSAGAIAQVRVRANGRGLGDERGLYDGRANVTYNVISGGGSGTSTNVALRAEGMVGYAVQDIRNGCSIYIGGSAYGRGELATTNQGAANSIRFMAGPETGLACDVGGVLLELSPSVGILGATNATSTADFSSQNPQNPGGAAVVGGGVARLTVFDRLHLSARAATTISNSELSGGPTANMTLVGADVDVRVNDNWSIGLNADGIQYATDPKQPNVTHQDGTVSASLTAVF